MTSFLTVLHSADVHNKTLFFRVAFLVCILTFSHHLILYFISFFQCSTTCGKGIQLREVSCKVYKPGRGTVIVSDNNCNAIERPERELLCNVHNPCPGVGMYL